MHIKISKTMLMAFCLFMTNCVFAMDRSNNYTWTISTFDDNGTRWDTSFHEMNNHSYYYSVSRRNSAFSRDVDTISHQPNISVNALSMPSHTLPHMPLQQENDSSQQREDSVVSAPAQEYASCTSLVNILQSFVHALHSGAMSVEAINVDSLAYSLQQNNVLYDTHPHVQDVVNTIISGLHYAPFYHIYEMCLHAVYNNTLSLSTLLNGFYHVSHSHGVASPEYDTHIKECQLEAYLRIKTLKTSCDMLYRHGTHMPSLICEYTSEMPVREKLIYDITMNIVANLDIDAIHDFYHGAFIQIVPPQTRVRAMYAYASTYGSMPEQWFTQRQKDAFDHAFRQYLHMSSDRDQSTFLDMSCNL